MWHEDSDCGRSISSGLAMRIAVRRAMVKIPARTSATAAAVALTCCTTGTRLAVDTPTPAAATTKTTNKKKVTPTATPTTMKVAQNKKATPPKKTTEAAPGSY